MLGGKQWEGGSPHNIGLGLKNLRIYANTNDSVNDRSIQISNNGSELCVHTRLAIVVTQTYIYTNPTNVFTTYAALELIHTPTGYLFVVH